MDVDGEKPVIMEQEEQPRMDEDNGGEDEDSNSSSGEEESSDDEGDESNQRAFVPGHTAALEQDEELVMDEQAYVVYHQAHLGPPCLSFDLIPDAIDPSRDEYPLTVHGVAGTQAAKAGGNSIIAFKMFNLHPIRNKDDEDVEEEEDDDGKDNQTDPERQPKLKVSSIKHNGAINRIRYRTLGVATVAAAWSETGKVGIFNLTTCLQKLEEPARGLKEWYRESLPPLFDFNGHLTEGYALNWSPTVPGVLATGDCRKSIHLWKPGEAGTWMVDQRPLVGHKASVEDVLWSPNEEHVLASCSVDKSIRIWDCRAKPDKACMLTVSNSHESDVNVLDWNASEPFIASGGDDGYLKIWDLRQFKKGQPVATFKHHAAPVTSVEWHHTDPTVLATSGADDQIALWDLAIEKDEESLVDSPELKDIPPQLLFIHQGLKEIKEIHWHKKIPGLVVSTSHSGFDVFKTISV